MGTLISETLSVGNDLADVSSQFNYHLNLDADSCGDA